MEKEARLRAEHAEEMNNARAQLEALKDTESRRSLNNYYKVRYKTGLFNNLPGFKLGSEQIIKCLKVLVKSQSQHNKPTVTLSQ